MTVRYLIPALTTMILWLAAGCGQETSVPHETERCTVSNARVEVNDRRMTVIWDSNCAGHISGYYIYISEEPVAERHPGSHLPESVAPFNHSPFPGDTVPGDNVQHFEAEGLQNGIKYYVSVRVVYPDRSLSKPTNEVTAVCGPRGEIELSTRFTADDDGYSLEQNEYVRADALANDLYFFAKDGIDYLTAPARLSGFLKENRFQILPFRGTFEQVRQHLSTVSAEPTDDRIAVATGDWIWMTMPDRTTALLKVLGITGQGRQRRIKLFFAYSPLPNEPIF